MTEKIRTLAAKISLFLFAAVAVVAIVNFTPSVSMAALNSTLTVESISAYPGQFVQIPVTVDTLSNVASMTLNFKFDPILLTPGGVDIIGLNPDYVFTNSLDEQTASGIVSIIYANDPALLNLNNQQLVLLNFVVNTSAATSTSVSIDTNGSIIDDLGNELFGTYTLVDGSVSISNAGIFTSIKTSLLNFAIDSNIDICDLNPTSCSGFYFAMQPLGKITFPGPINLDDPETILYLQNLQNFINISSFPDLFSASVGMDVRSAPALLNAPAQIELYGLPVGFNLSNLSIIAYDDLGNKIPADGLVSNINYQDAGNCAVNNNCAVVTFDVAHFTSYEVVINSISLAEVTPVPAYTNNSSPTYTFSSNEAGIVNLSGGCATNTMDVLPGNTTITLTDPAFAPLVDGTYNCVLEFFNVAGLSKSLMMTPFTIDTIAPVTPPVITNLTNPVNISNQLDFSFSGTGEAGGTIVYSITDTLGASVNGSFPIDPNGNFTIPGMTVFSLQDGLLTLTAHVVDKALNAGPATSVTTTKFIVQGSSYNITLNSGWNLITLPAQPIDITNNLPIDFTAESFGQLASADVVVQWDSINQQYKSHVVGLPIGDFTITNGMGFFIHENAAKTVTFQGLPINYVVPVAVSGWNLFGYNNTFMLAASAYGSSILGADVISKFDSATQQWTTHIVGLPLNNFMVLPGEALFVHKP